MKPKRSQKQSPRRAAPKRKPAKRVAKAKAKPKAKAKTKSKAKAKPAAKRRTGGVIDWPAFVERHGVVLASARGPVPSVAEAIAGEPIVGSWWSHARGQAIFDALSEIDDSDDVRCFKLIDHKITFVHRRVWPALVALARAGVVAADRVESIQQEHMPTGEHRNFKQPFPEWVPDDVAAQAAALTVEAARAQLGAWV